jgi:hypothetical protein
MRFKQFKYLVFIILIRYLFKNDFLLMFKRYKNSLYGKYSYYGGRIENYKFNYNNDIKKY